MIRPIGWTLGAALALAAGLPMVHQHSEGDAGGDETRTAHSIRIWGHDIGVEVFVRRATHQRHYASSESTPDAAPSCRADGATPVVIVLPGGTLQYRP